MFFILNYLFIIFSSGGISIEEIQPSFLFARFENAAAEAGVEIAQQQSFQNPMFSLAGVSEYLSHLLFKCYYYFKFRDLKSHWTQ
jgi:hypothetical protein